MPYFGKHKDLCLAQFYLDNYLSGELKMNARRLHPFEYQLYRDFANGKDKDIDVIFEKPTDHVILVAFNDDNFVGAVHIDVPNKNIIGINSDYFDDALTMAQNWCAQHNLVDPNYTLITA